MAGRIRVFHVEDYKIARDGMKFILSEERDIQLIGQAHNADDLFRNLDNKKTDVLLLDLYLDAMTDLEAPDGFDILEHVQKKYAEVAILAHSIYDDGDTVAKFINGGGAGFVSKKAGFEELIKAIKTVATGKKYICSETLKKLKNANMFLTGRDKLLISKEELFSKREREVLELVAQGFSSKEIAHKLFITEKTVESHRKNMVDKAGVKNTVQLTAHAAFAGLI
ncbi:MAG TPA: response regulator transcription factor [Chryseolinea sp.]|nr:response regulator transcription factor [Chryseolinea sp.]